jgi:hypothetical protein
MTREDIIERMGWLPSAENGMSDIINRIERIVNRAVEAEREACAEIADSVDNYANPMTARDCAEAIRARGSK